MTETQFRDAAKEQYHQEGYLEIDPDAQVNVLDIGAYVQAWVWVDDPEQE